MDDAGASVITSVVEVGSTTVETVTETVTITETVGTVVIPASEHTPLLSETVPPKPKFFFGIFSCCFPASEVAKEVMREIEHDTEENIVVVETAPEVIETLVVVQESSTVTELTEVQPTPVAAAAEPVVVSKIVTEAVEVVDKSETEAVPKTPASDKAVDTAYTGKKTASIASAEDFQKLGSKVTQKLRGIGGKIRTATLGARPKSMVLADNAVVFEQANGEGSASSLADSSKAESSNERPVPRRSMSGDESLAKVATTLRNIGGKMKTLGRPKSAVFVDGPVLPKE